MAYGKENQYPARKKDGTEEYSIGILDWTLALEQEGKSEDLREDGKMTSTNS